jgi:hypothetical protein
MGCLLELTLDDFVKVVALVLIRKFEFLQMIPDQHN